MKMFRPKDARHLTARQWAMVKGVREATMDDAIHQAAAAGEIDCLNYLFKKSPLNWTDLINRYAPAFMDKGYSPPVIECVLGLPAHMFGIETDELFRAAARSRKPVIWDIVEDYYLRRKDRLRLSFFKTCVDHGFYHGVESALDKVHLVEKEACLSYAARHGEFLIFKMVVDHIIQTNKKSLLDDALPDCVDDRQKIQYLVDCGADLNASAALAALQRSVRHPEIFDYLLRKGVKPDNATLLFIDKWLSHKDTPQNIAAQIRKIAERYDVIAVQRVKLDATEGGRFSLPAPDTMAEVQKLPTGGTLTILFNFNLRQQMIVAEKENAEQKTAPLVVTPFSLLEEDVLEVVARRFLDLGGDASFINPHPRRTMIRKD